MESLYKKIERISYEQKSTVGRTERLAGLSKGTISKWKASSPRVDTLRRVAAVLNCTIDDLIEE